MAFYGDAQYDSPYYAPSPQAERPALGSSIGYDTFTAISASQHPSVHPSHSTFEATTAYAPYATGADSFNSPMVPNKSLVRDGRLKTKLMGVGSDGGFLTSPIVVGNSRMAPLSGDIQIASPAPTAMGRGDSSFGDGGASLPSPEMDFSGGMGMGITGVSELQTGLEMGDYGSANLKIFGMPKTQSTSRTRTTSECGYLPYPEHLPTTTLGRGKNNLRDVAPIPPIPDKYVDQRFRSPPPQAGIPVAPATARKSVNRKGLTVRTLNKAKSLSSLNQGAAFEPLTPVSSHGPNFFNIPGVPFNSPVDEEQQQQQQHAPEPGIMPFTFSDLYNFGLAVDSTDDIDPRKSPLAFANDVVPSPAHQQQSYSDDADFNLLHSLPTPYLAHGSGFSSPSTTYLSDPSPDLLQHRSPHQHSGSTTMLSAPLMEQQYSIPFSNGPPPPSPSRQRCATYGQRHPSSSHAMRQDPNLLVGAPSSSMQRGASIPPYTAPRYSYPTRYGSDQGQSHAQALAVAGPYSSNQGWSNEQVIASYGLPTPEAQLQSLFQAPPTLPPLPYDEKYEQNLEAFEDMYDHYSQGTTGFGTPGKRGREIGRAHV